ARRRSARGARPKRRSRGEGSEFAAGGYTLPDGHPYFRPAPGSASTRCQVPVHVRPATAAALAAILALGGAWRVLEARARAGEPLAFGDERMYFAMGVGLKEGRVL